MRTNRNERVQTSDRLSYKIDLRRMHTTTHGEVSRRLHQELKTVYKSVLEPPFQAQISDALSPHTKDCFNTCYVLAKWFVCRDVFARPFFLCAGSVLTFTLDAPSGNVSNSDNYVFDL